MTPEIHRAALRAAAKLALSAAVFGCGGATETTEPTSTKNGTDDTSSTATGADESALHARHHKPSAKTYCDAMHSYETEEQCCKTVVANATFPTHPQLTGNPDPSVDTLTRACCTVLAKAADAAQDWSWQERGECCAAIGWNAAATCTPWGPPVPPPMRRRARSPRVA